MDRSSVLLVVLVSLFASVLAQTSAFDCMKKPAFNADVKSCCKRPAVNIDKYKAVCYNTTTNASTQAYMDPCGVECIFTKSGSLMSNGTFNYLNLQTLFKNIMPNDPELAKLFLAGFKTCAPDIQKKVKEFNSKKMIKLPGASPCSPQAVMTSFCAMRYVFINCPSNMWTSSEMCNSAQAYAKNCDPLKMPTPSFG